MWIAREKTLNPKGKNIGFESWSTLANLPELILKVRNSQNKSSNLLTNSDLLLQLKTLVGFISGLEPTTLSFKAISLSQ